MKKLINCRETIILDENFIKPNCPVCNRELTQFVAEPGFPEDLKQTFLDAKLGKYYKGDFLFLMCKNCVLSEGE